MTKDQNFLLRGIANNLSINVSRWVKGNIQHAIENASLGIPNPTLLTELNIANGLDITNDEVLQPKGPLNFKAMIRIQQVEGGNSGAAIRSSSLDLHGRPQHLSLEPPLQTWPEPTKDRRRRFRGKELDGNEGHL